MRTLPLTGLKHSCSGDGSAASELLGRAGPVPSAAALSLSRSDEAAARPRALGSRMERPLLPGREAAGPGGEKGAAPPRGEADPYWEGVRPQGIAPAGGRLIFLDRGPEGHLELN